MRKSKKYKKSKRKTNRHKNKRGGSYYRYNNYPTRFTSSTTQLGGSGFNMDTRNTFLPDSLVTLGRSFMYELTPTTIMGTYNSHNPDPSVQPIMFKNN